MFKLYLIILIIILNSSECLSSPEIFSSIWNSIFDVTSSTPSTENVQVLKLNNNGNLSLFNLKPAKDSNDNIKETIAYSCAGCINNKFSITSEQLTALRIEYIKHQILSKLRLKEPPKITLPLSDLPLPALIDNMILSRTQNEKYSDDFYGKTAQAIFFTNNDVKCYQKFHGASVCLPFNITTDIHESDLRSAELWLYKVKDKLDSHNQTFVISEFAHWDSNKSFQKMKPIAIYETNIGQDWMVIDVMVFIRNWIKYQDYIHTINVVCKTCAMDANKSPIHTKKDGFKPFLILKTFSEMKRRLRKSRMKRSLNCVPGLNECCRDALHISFAEIGWNNWILSPSGYNAYFCHGSCSTAAAITLTEPNYNSVIQKLLYGSKTNRKLELIPCCAATQFKSLELTYANNRSFITKKILPNMIVDTCGCM